MSEGLDKTADHFEEGKTSTGDKVTENTTPMSLIPAKETPISKPSEGEGLVK